VDFCQKTVKYSHRQLLAEELTLIHQHVVELVIDDRLLTLLAAIERHLFRRCDEAVMSGTEGALQPLCLCCHTTEARRDSLYDEAA